MIMKLNNLLELHYIVVKVFKNNNKHEHNDLSDNSLFKETYLFCLMKNKTTKQLLY